MEKYITSDKIFYHTDELNKWNNGVSTNPITVELHLTNKCNNACYYCCMHHVKNAQEMSKSDVITSVRSIKELGAKAIIFSGGGEPTVSKYFDEAVFQAVQNGLDVGIITNGVNLDKVDTKFILNNCSWLRVSVDSDSNELYKKIRGINHFDTVMNNIGNLLKEKELLNSKCTIGLQIVVNEYNYDRLVEISSYLLNKFKNINYLQVRPIEIKFGEEPYSKEELIVIDKQLIMLAPLNRVLINKKWDLFFGKREFGFTACHCCEMIGTVDAYGDYYLCCHTVRKPAYKFFNVLKDDLSEFTLKKLNCLDKLGSKKGFDINVCPVGCRGSAINRSLEGVLHEPEHKNFL